MKPARPSAVRWTAAALIAGTGALWLTHTDRVATAQDAPEASAPEARVQPRAQGGAADMGAMLMQALSSSPGCLGVDAANMQSGKQAIFAWFEDADAARAWYHHPMHEGMVRMTGGDPATGQPLAHVEDEDSPVMVIATLTPSDTPELEGLPMPISQISIEMYTPLPGGVAINGRLAPDSMTVPHMQVHNDDDSDDTAGDGE